MDTQDEKDEEPAIENLNPNCSEQETPTPLLSKAGRPIRRAAKQAHKIDSIKTSPPISKWKHGWKEEDQDCDSDYFPVPTSNLPIEQPDDIQPSSDTEETSLNATDSDSTEELTWDDSPLQIALSKSISSPPTLIPPSSANVNNPTRRLATSEQSLQRSDAFRHPPDASRVPLFQHQFPTRFFYSSRIPRPTTPTDVQLNHVTDLTNLPGLVHTPAQPPPTLNPRAPRRSVQQPSDYKLYGETGRR